MPWAYGCMCNYVRGSPTSLGIQSVTVHCCTHLCDNYGGNGSKLIKLFNKLEGTQRAQTSAKAKISRGVEVFHGGNISCPGLTLKRVPRS